MIRAPLRDFIRDLVTRVVERTRGEISQGIQDAVVPIISDFVMSCCIVAMVLFGIIVLIKMVK